MKIFIKKQENIKKILVVFLAVLLLFFALNYFQKNVRSFLYSLFTPIQKTFWRIGDKANDFFGAFVKTRQNYNELEELRIQNQNLEFQLAQFQDIKKENETLREALNIGLEKEFKLTMAEITGRYISQEFVLIDKGSRDGVTKNMPAITATKVLAGRVDEVYEQSSRVFLITNKGNYLDARIQDKFDEAVVKGAGNGMLSLNLVPREADISEGDIVISMGANGTIPAGLLIGKVKSAKKTDLEPFQQIEVTPFFDVRQTNKLFLIEAY